MCAGRDIADFIEGIRNDPYRGLNHIGLYAVLWQLLQRAADDGSLRISRDDLMRTAKVGSRTTYFRLLNDLSGRGYIRYRPSFNRNGGSRISLPAEIGPGTILIVPDTMKSRCKKQDSEQQSRKK